MPRPIYMFTGIIDSGKTTAIKDTLADPYFNDGSKTLIVCFEQGEVEYDKEFLEYTHSQVIYPNYADFGKQMMLGWVMNYDFDRLFIEFNGMENDIEFLEKGLIDEFEIAEIICVNNTAMFEVYINNLRQYMYNHLKNADLSIFNRYTIQNKQFLRNSVKGINPFMQVIFEKENGEIEEYTSADVFDLSKDLVEVGDQDYGLWYLDAIDDPYKYENKKLRIKAYKVEDQGDYLLMGRKAMVCCSDDTQDVCFPCVNVKDKEAMEKGKYYTLTGTIKLADTEDGQKTCVLTNVTYVPDSDPKYTYVTFY
ncbi:MAG: hypothetical protein IKE33_05540 [Erysipelotrichaceae bacterium]|nr:hypothetical protein [Erysipelotrichaceae bacterium]